MSGRYTAHHFQSLSHPTWWLRWCLKIKLLKHKLLKETITLRIQENKSVLVVAIAPELLLPAEPPQL